MPPLPPVGCLSSTVASQRERQPASEAPGNNPDRIKWIQTGGGLDGRWAVDLCQDGTDAMSASTTSGVIWEPVLMVGGCNRVDG